LKKKKTKKVHEPTKKKSIIFARGNMDDSERRQREVRWRGGRARCTKCHKNYNAEKVRNQSQRRKHSIFER
jgi:predicted phosphodiesterase